MSITTGEQLQHIRLQHNVTQRDMAEWLGYSVNGKPNPSMIARLENGYAKINPRVSKLLTLYFSNMHETQS